jgi:hypothetical protein
MFSGHPPDLQQQNLPVVKSWVPKTNVPQFVFVSVVFGWKALIFSFSIFLEKKAKRGSGRSRDLP